MYVFKFQELIPFQLRAEARSELETMTAWVASRSSLSTEGVRGNLTEDQTVRWLRAEYGSSPSRTTEDAPITAGVRSIPDMRAGASDELGSTYIDVRKCIRMPYRKRCHS